MISLIIDHFGAAIINCDPSQTANNNCDTNFPKITPNSVTAQNALQVVFGIISVVAIIYIIISAIRFQTTLGNPEASAKLRNTIIFAGVGLVIALSAEAIVTLTLGRL